MKQKIIFFDIDGTLFDSSKFLNLFYDKLLENFGIEKDENKLSEIYSSVKNQYGYFLPGEYINNLASAFSIKDRDKLENIFYDIDLFEKSVYKDSSGILKLAEKIKFAIFSQGEKEFQKKKISFMLSALRQEDIFIFTNKYRQANEVFPRYSQYNVYLLDNDLELLKGIGELFSEVKLVLIDREDKYKDNKDIRVINSLDELGEIINE
jgi:FMN phosphatase YigB (HAD superfamily)